MGASTNARDRAIAGRSTIRTPEKRSSAKHVYNSSSCELEPLKGGKWEPILKKLEQGTWS
uniref:Uncharacterized protein n=1 Tax=Oryza glumipatula TaxID=40148 RepID=A0A0E0B1X3_9ORYZ